MGSRQIADYLNMHGIRTQTGGRWGLGAVHQILTRQTCIGRHRFNVSGKRKQKSEDEIADVTVEPIIGEEEFAEVQAVMRSRSPQLKAPRFVAAGTLLGGVCFCADRGGAMTLRTSGKGDQYRYYTCCTTARQGKTACRGRTIRMDELDTIVVSHLEERLLAPERLEELLGGLLKRREEHAGRLKGRIAELRKQAADAEAKLTRLYEAIENGLAEMDDANLKGRIVELKRTRDAARADADRAEDRGEGDDNRVTLELLRRFGVEARKKIRRLPAPSPSGASAAGGGRSRRNSDQGIDAKAPPDACCVWRKLWSGNCGVRRPQFRSEMAPIVDAYRTICIAPTPEVKAVFEAIREFGSAA